MAVGAFSIINIHYLEEEKCKFDYMRQVDEINWWKVYRLINSPDLNVTQIIYCIMFD